jgi:hypothetical protein
VTTVRLDAPWLHARLYLTLERTWEKQLQPRRFVEAIPRRGTINDYCPGSRKETT